jgi:hypothetical protein
MIDAFDDFYRTYYSDRWPLLKTSLLEPVFSLPFQKELKKPYFLNLASYLAVQSLGEIGDQDVLDLCAAPGARPSFSPLLWGREDPSWLMSDPVPGGTG